MKIKRILRTLIILLVLSSNIGCDQISKNMARQRLHDHEQISLINNHLTLTLIRVENTGAFLSLGHSLPHPLKILLLSAIPLVIIGLGTFYLLTKEKMTNATLTGISFIIGGGIGNIYDRIVYGSVTDFLHIDLVVFQTGIFNMADVSIMTGIFIILVDSFRWSKLGFKTDHKQRDV